MILVFKIREQNSRSMGMTHTINEVCLKIGKFWTGPEVPFQNYYIVLCLGTNKWHVFAHSALRWVEKGMGQCTEMVCLHCHYKKAITHSKLRIAHRVFIDHFIRACSSVWSICKWLLWRYWNVLYTLLTITALYEIWLFHEIYYMRIIRVKIQFMNKT